ncbi:hypothetical protein [Yoonia sp. I 8.24]|uniref:hypothetical protein n=1 Tax=Yoonia sp. I 8.24 TaxID=1537229 RepID=UPI001EDE8A7C|nr:hypothetical protein [Yoonia sp. I 8.24]MCG3269577.1 hypothetical protein [Yoonia sp. I 8.24]
MMKTILKTAVSVLWPLLPPMLYAEPVITPILLTGDPAPGNEDATVDFLNEPVIGDSGAIAFRGIVERIGLLSRSVEDGIYLARENQALKIFDHEAADLRHRGQLSDWVGDDVQLGSLDELIFKVGWDDGPTPTYVGAPELLGPLFNPRSSDPLEKAIASATLFDMDSAGHSLTFEAHCHTDSVSSCKDGLYHLSSDGIIEVVDLAQPFTLEQSGQTLTWYKAQLRVNALEQAVLSVVSDNTDQIAFGIYLLDGDSRTLIFEHFDTGPVRGRIVGLIEHAILADDGTAYFALEAWSGSENRGNVLYGWSGETPIPVVSTEEVALPPGWSTNGFRDICANAQGTVAFTLPLFRPNPDDPKNNIYAEALYIQHSEAAPARLIGPGDEIDLGHRGTGIVASVNSVGHTECALSNYGEMAVTIEFEDKTSGVFRISNF